MRKLALLLLLLVLCGCQPSAVISDEGLIPTQVYYISNEQMLAPHEVAISSVTEEAKIRTLFSALQARQTTALVPAISSEILLKSYTLHSGTLTLELTDAYDSYRGISKTLADAAIAMSFCQLDDVDQVVIRTASSESAPLTANDYVFTIPTPISAQQSVTLYFVSGSDLTAESRVLLQEADTSLANSVVTALLAGPKTAGLKSAIPSGTRLHSVVVEDGLCTVDLSSEFLALPSHSEEAERLCLFSLVNTLAGVPEVEHVQVLINGTASTGFTHYDLTQAIQPEVFN